MAEHNDLGALGEAIAIEYLLKNNYKIVEKNWRFKKAEVDIIALKDNILAIIEVKTRSTDFFGNPQDFVYQKKINLLVEAVNEYVISHDLDVEVRFDIIAIVKKQHSTEIKHLEDAFYHF